MADIGLKVVQAGANIDTADVREILMSSQYSMLKYRSDNTASVTLVPGDSDKYAEISHTLGYVPAFIAYIKIDGVQYFINPPRASGFTSYPYAWASSSVVRCGYAYSTGAYGQVHVGASDWWDEYYQAISFARIGVDNGSNIRNAAFRFDGVALPNATNISSAYLNFEVDAKGAGSGDLKIKTYGIDEDNTSAFNISESPLTRPQTSAFSTQDVSLPPVGEGFGINVTSQTQEIVSRAGWISGNAMGFAIYDNGSPSDVSAYDEPLYGSGDNSLTVTFGEAKTVDFRVVIFKDRIST